MKNKIIKKALSVVLALGIFAGQPDMSLKTFAENIGEAFTGDIMDDDYFAAEKRNPLKSMVTLQNGAKAVCVTPTIDFDPKNSETGMASVCETAVSYGMNAVIINSDYDGVIYYDINSNAKSASDYALEAVRKAGLHAYITLNVNTLISEVKKAGGGLKNGFGAAVHKFAMKYACDGIILTDYYTFDTINMFSEYMHCGSGIGYNNWLYETNEFIVRSVSEIIHQTNNTTAVGLLISDMWANSSSNKLGSETNDNVQAMYDGHCNTKKYVEKKYADFVLVKAYGSTSSDNLDFEKVVSWWNNLSELNGIKLYVLHLNEKIGNYSDWKEDQLLRQLTVLKDYGSVWGSAFNSLPALKNNALGSTDTLLKFFNKEINPDTLFEDLEMTSPSSQNFVTYDSSVKFMGTFDENFDVYFDGEKIDLNDAGNFYIKKDLNIGPNSFVIEHKGKSLTYSIERQIDVMTSIDESSVEVEGGSQVALMAVAYGGSRVSASINGQIVNLSEISVSGEELDANSSYANFVGYYTVPNGITGQEQYLGNVTYYANYNGYEEYMTGGSITVLAAPEPPEIPDVPIQEIQEEINQNQETAGSGEVVGTMPPIIPDTQSVTYVKVLNNYTNVYDAKTTGKILFPVFSQLPAGTLDYYKSESGGFITTTSGKRFRAEDVATFTDTGLGDNKLVVKSVGNSSGNSYLKIHMRYRASFNITTQTSFFDDIEGPYGVKNFNASYIYITFDNITEVTKLPEFDKCTLFSGGAWETIEENGVPKFRLTLTLRQPGVYAGCAAYYDDNGDLILSFGIPTASLSGKTIVIDPGHGYGKTPEKLDPGAIGNVTEQSVNYAVSLALEQKLAAMGANVVRLKTESEFILTKTRPTIARSYGADMYISLHCNSVDNDESAHGVEVYYFTPFSQPLAKAINDKLSSYYENSVYADGTKSNRGAKYSYFDVTLQQDFPSVLVEMGFISNERECMVMADPVYQSGIAESIANGIYNYYAGSGLIYGGDSGTDIPAQEVITPPALSETTETTGTASQTSEASSPESSSETEITDPAASESEIPSYVPPTSSSEEPQYPIDTGEGIRVE